MTLTSAVGPRPHAAAPPPPDAGLEGWLLIGGVFAAFMFCLFLAIGLLLGIFYRLDLRLHEGVSVFKRRRVLRRGIEADATILSSTMSMRTTLSRFTDAYSNVYEVHPSGAPPFRAKGIEVMSFSESSDNRLEQNGRVRVRYDPDDHTVVIVRVDRQKVQREREQAQRAREEALLRGGG
jgi:hypothetical protein